MKATIILGLCGSEKTYRANKLADETGARIPRGRDDPSDLQDRTDRRGLGACCA